MGKKIFIISLVIMFCLMSCKVDQDITDTPSVTIGNQIGQEAPDFTEKDTDNNDFKLGWWKGEVVLLCFSTWWCAPCRAEAPKLVKLVNKFKDQGFRIVQCVYQDENGSPATIDDIKRWRKTFQLNFTVVNDPDKSTVKRYNFKGIPFNILIDRNLIIQYRQAGYKQAEVEAKIEELLKK